MRPTLTILLVWLMAAPVQQFAQEPAPASPLQRPQTGTNSNGLKTFNLGGVSTQLVVEDVIIKSKDGSPVTGFKAGDFSILEDGKPQDIKVFEFQKLEDEALPQQQALQTRADAKQPAGTPEPPAKPVIAAQIAAEKPGDIKYKDKRLMVMFFDMTSMPIQDQLRAQSAAQKFIRTQMTPSDLMAIMTFSNDVKVVEDFTDDRDQLQKDIRNLIIGEGQGFDPSASDDSAADTGAAFQQDDSEFNIFNTDRQLSALETAVKMLGSLNEKKALVYFASGMTRNGMDNQAQLQATVNAAIRANVSFYPIDARGLVAQAPLGDATKGSPGGQGMYSGSSARSAAGNFQNQQETLYTLASDTGGKALLDNNDLAMGIVQAQKDISSYYIIGYYSKNEALDGHFRRIKISLKDSTKIAKMDYRQGYFAGKVFAKFTDSDKERQLSEALMLADPITEIDLAMEIDYFRLARDRYFVPVVAKIPGSELVAASKGGAETARIEFIGQIKDSKGKVVENVRDSADVKLKGEAAGQLAKHPLVYPTGFTLPPGSYDLKFLVRDNATGKMGTYEAKFLIPDLTAEAKLLPISSVILSSQRMDPTEAVFNAERNKKLLALNPLIQDGKQLVPSVTRVFNKSQEMFVYLEAYQPLAASTQPLLASVTFFRGKSKAFETAPLEVTQGLNDKSKAVPLRFSVPMSKLQPGRYTCQVSVLDPTAQRFAFWRAPMLLVQ
jgi:VWFA-related protein